MSIQKIEFFYNTSGYKNNKLREELLEFRDVFVPEEDSKIISDLEVLAKFQEKLLEDIRNVNEKRKRDRT